MDIEPTCVNLFRSAWLWNAESLQNDEETHNDKVKTVIANLYGPDFFFTTSFQRWATTSFPGLDIEILLPLPSRCPGNALIGPRIRCSSLPRGIMSICPLFAQRLDRVNTKSHLCFHPWHSFPPFLTLHARPSHNKSQHTSSNGVQLFSWAREWNSRQTK
jgi:hypothetical protein